MTEQPIAVVGMACRFPQGLNDIQTLWDALKNRFNAAGPVPADRWDTRHYFSSNAASRGKAYIQRGGFLNQDLTSFDASFFGISPREAENMDPQQRLMLEVVWEAFENAGIPVGTQAGNQVGVYVGGFMLDHMITQMSPANRSQINQHSAAGMMMTMLSNRISHTYDLRGPSLSIDTACSSSLVAFNYACQDIWRGTTDMAVVGGVNAMMRPEYPMGMCKGHFLSRDGESKSFDSRGDGYGRSEGAGAVLLKPLEVALREGDNILSTVIASGTNQDGCTPGISMPNGDAQQALIEDVCRRFEVDPLSVDYVECHGTGTAIGDPTESKAIGATYGKGRTEANRVVVGSIKSNVGHMEACAGVAGVIKGVLTSLYRTATPLGNLQSVNEEIDFDGLGIRLSDELIEVGAPGRPVRVAVNSFGYGGSNAHAILESFGAAERAEAELHRPAAMEQCDCGEGCCGGDELGTARELPLMLPVTGRSVPAIRELAGRIGERLDQGVDLRDTLYTLSMRREHSQHRAVAMGKDRQELAESLASLAESKENPNVVLDSRPFSGRRECVFVFTGMGPQWWGMGQELYRESKIYRESVDRADRLFQEIAGFSILAEMNKSEEESQIILTQYAQPANLVIQIGLLDMLKAAGITPSACVGHSVGELGSAYAAGVLNLQDVLKVSYHRSQLQATTAHSGSMLAVGISKEDALSRIAEFSDLVSIAAVNGASTVTLAGDTAKLQELEAEFTAEDIFSKMLTVEVPYHSPLMDPLMPKLEAKLQGVQTNAPEIPLYSTVTGGRVTEPSFGAEYWPLNIRQPVEFADAMAAILDDGYNTFLEVGPHPVLSSAIRDCITVSGKECRQLFTLRRMQPELINVHRAVAGVFASGCAFDWTHLNGRGELVALPNYAWQREKLWLENDRAMQERIGQVVHPILGIQHAMCAPVWRNDFDHETVNYLRDHIVSGMPILPAAGYIESLFELAALHHPDAHGLSIRDVSIEAPMVIQPDKGLDFTTTYDAIHQFVQIRSLENGKLGTGKIHLTANIAALPKAAPTTGNLDQIRETCDTEADTETFYRELNQIGLQYGPLFQGVRRLWPNQEAGEVLAEVTVDPSLAEDMDGYLMHPTMLDGCFQTLMSLLSSSDTTYLPTHVSELNLYVDSAPRRVWCHGRMTEQTDRHIDCDLTLYDDAGNVIGTIRSLRATAAASSQRTDQFGDPVKRQVLDYEWLAGETLAEPRRFGHWLVVGANSETVQGIVNQIENYGAMIAARVSLGDDFRHEGDEFVIRGDSIEDATRVMQHCGELNGVVFAQSLDDSVALEDPTGHHALQSIVTMTQAMLQKDAAERPRVYVLTQNAFAVDEYDDAVVPRHSACNGFVRVACNELEGFRFSSLDLPTEVTVETADAAALELLCDAPEDEVAIRQDMRYVSELLETPRLDEDRVEYASLTDDRPVQVRPLQPGSESVGTVRILAAPKVGLGDDGIRIAVDSSLLPMNLVSDQSSSEITQPLIEVVGRVLEVGSQVDDLQVGQAVCGFAPADLASQLVGPRRDFHLVAIESAEQADALLALMGERTQARRAVESTEIESGEHALVVADPMGIAVAKELATRDVHLTFVHADALGGQRLDEETADLFPGASWIDACPEQLATAVQERTGGRRFAALVGPMRAWRSSFDFRTLSDGGSVIDTDREPTSFVVPASVSSLAKTDLGVIAMRPRRLAETLRSVVDEIVNAETASPDAFVVSVHDIAWQLLPLSEATSKVVLNYQTDGQDLPIIQRDDLEFHSDATYAITGGFGGFGRKTARWLIDHGARHLVLTGRRGADDADKREFVAEMEALGATVYPAACDTSDLDQVQDLIKTINETMPPLKGVYHSAAVIHDQAVNEVELDKFAVVMQSKALGAWNLHLATQECDLDQFVLYSSLANQVGNSRQCAYSAANGFLNGLAAMRRSAGLAGIAVCWGAISDVGIVARDEKLEQFLRYVGLRGIPSAEGLGLLGKALNRQVTQFGVVLITSWADWARFETLGGRSPRFASLIAEDSSPEDNALREQLIEELTGMPDADQIELVGSLVREIVAAVLKSDAEGISMDRPVSELGVDSLMATEIQQMFDAQLGLQVSVLELVSESTLRSLAISSLESLGTATSLPPKGGASSAAQEPPAEAATVGA